MDGSTSLNTWRVIFSNRNTFTEVRFRFIMSLGQKAQALVDLHVLKYKSVS